jgi:hypothetical protein
MTFRLTFAWSLAVAVLLLGPALSPMASAQDVMQLDTEFRNSLLRGPSSPEQGEGRHLQQPQIEPARRHPRRHRHKRV